MTADVLQFLRDLDLTDKEAQLYIYSLKSGAQTASTLAKKTGMPRSTVHFLMEGLMQKGFATKENREKTSYYSVIEPESLEYILLQKNVKLKKQMEDLKSLSASFEAMKGQKTLFPKVRYYSGLEALCRTVDDCCMKDETVAFISSHANMHPKLRQYVEKIYIPRSKKHHNKNKMIIADTEESRAYLKKAEGVYDEIHFINPKKYPLKLTLAIHGNKVDFISYDIQDLSGVIIENELVADHMRTMFKMLADSSIAK